ncbi:MAG: hypothetical protein IPP29_21785 [Bacteroidetes bacterium]|nr:hypothetical protein [Bacteroidota bacterium]
MNENVFTKREMDIINEIKKAKSRKIIADALCISINTLDKHLHSIHLKTKTHSVAELMNWLYNGKA